MTSEGVLRWARDLDTDPWHLSFDGRVTACGVSGFRRQIDQWRSLRSAVGTVGPRCFACQRVISAKLGLPEPEAPR